MNLLERPEFKQKFDKLSPEKQLEILDMQKEIDRLYEKIENTLAKMAASMVYVKK